MRILAGVTLIAAVGLTGCSDEPTRPAERRGEYELVSVNGDAVPAAVAIVEGTVTITEITSGTLRLWPDDTHTLVLATQARSGTGPIQPAAWAIGGEFTLAAGTVTLDLGDAIGVRMGTFGRSGGRQTLSIDAGPPFGVLVFRKTGS